MVNSKIKFKVYAPNYSKIASVNLFGLSYQIKYFIPIYDHNFHLPSSGSLYDVSRNDFLLEDGISHLDWWSQYENVSGGEVVSFNGQKIWLRGSVDPNSKKYIYASGYTLDYNNENVTTGLFNQNKLLSSVSQTDCWRVYPYRPLAVSSSSGAIAAGSYDCVIPGNAGDFSWNKIALFLAEVDSSGNETGNIYFFGMIYSNVRLVKNRILDGSGQSISPNFTIRFNVIISGETYDAARYDYLFFTDSVWYYINSEAISTESKVVVGKYDVAHYNYYDSALTAIRDIADSSSKSFSIAGLIEENYPNIGLFKNFYEYKFDVVRSLLFNTGYTRALSIKALYNGNYDYTFGGVLLGNKIIWDAENGLAFDYTNTYTGKGIWHDNHSFGSWSVGFDIYNNGNYNFTFGDGYLGIDSTGLNYGLQTNGNYNFNFGLRNRIGAYFGGDSTYPRYGYNIFQFGNDNYSEGYSSIIFGNCNYSNQRFSYIFGYNNQNRIYNNNPITNHIGSVYSSTSGVDTHHRNVNVWILGSNNSVHGRGLGSGVTGDDGEFTDLLIIGSHNNVGEYSLARHLILGKNLSIGVGGLWNTRDAGILVGSDGYLSSAHNHISLMQLSTGFISSYSIANLSEYSYSGNLTKSFVVSQNNAMSNSLCSLSILDKHFDKSGAYGYLERPVNLFNSSGELTYILTGISDAVYGANVWNGATNSLTVRSIDKDNVADVWRTAWVYFSKWSIIGKCFEGNFGHTYSVGNIPNYCQIVHLQTSSSAIIVKMINSASASDYFVLDSAYSPEVLNKASSFVPSTRTVNGKRLYLYVTRLREYINPEYNNSAFHTSLSFFGELYQVIDVKPLGGTLYGFKVSPVDSNTPVYVPNTFSDGGFNFYQRGTAFVLIDDGEVDYLLSSQGRGFKGYIINNVGHTFHDIIFSARSYNSTRFGVTVLNNSEFHSSVGSLLISSLDFRGGRINSSLSIGDDIYLQSSHGSSFVGSKIRHLYVHWYDTVNTMPTAKHVYSNVNAQNKYERFNFQKDHLYLFDNRYGSYESVFDSWHGTELHANLNTVADTGGITVANSGHTAFTRLFGSHLYLGRDLLYNGRYGTSGIIYADLFGYDINVLVSDSGGRLYRPQYNIHAHGMHLLVTRSDQFVMGFLNEGSVSNIFEFGAGHGNYQKMREYNSEDDASREFTERKNGFAFGFLNDLYSADSDYYGRYPAFKLGTGILHFEDEWDNWGGGEPTRGMPDYIYPAYYTPRNRALITKKVNLKVYTQNIKEGDLIIYDTVLEKLSGNDSPDGSIYINPTYPGYTESFIERGMSNLYAMAITSDNDGYIEYSSLLNGVGKRLIGVSLDDRPPSLMNPKLLIAFKGGCFFVKIKHIPQALTLPSGFSGFLDLLPSSWRVIQKGFVQDSQTTYTGYFSIMID